MSMTTELIDKLKKYAQILEDTSTNRESADLMCIKTMREAAEVIEELSLKLHNSQMERSSQYYHGGWIPVSERLPEKEGDYIVHIYGACAVLHYCSGWNCYSFNSKKERKRNEIKDVKAWMPLPEPYKESEVNENE